MPADLHLHTHHSDGSWSPEALVEAALFHGLQCIAVTDHDTLSGVEPVTRAAAGRLEVIPGIEINTVLVSEDGGMRDVHILGYFVDPSSRALRSLIERQQDARNQYVDDVIAACAKNGVALSHEQVQAFIGIGSIGRPHLARAIVAAGGASSKDEAFERYFSRQSKDYVPRRAVGPQEAIKAIEASGGISSLAHPGNDERAADLIVELKAMGLQAVEAYHRSHGLELVQTYLRLAAKNKLLVTGGSDCHGQRNDWPPSIGSVKVPIDVVARLKSHLPTFA